MVCMKAFDAPRHEGILYSARGMIILAAPPPPSGISYPSRLGYTLLALSEIRNNPAPSIPSDSLHPPFLALPFYAGRVAKKSDASTRP
jgi:hypothetical protein